MSTRTLDDHAARRYVSQEQGIGAGYTENARDGAAERPPALGCSLRALLRAVAAAAWAALQRLHLPQPHRVLSLYTHSTAYQIAPPCPGRRMPWLQAACTLAAKTVHESTHPLEGSHALRKQQGCFMQERNE